MSRTEYCQSLDLVRSKAGQSTNTNDAGQCGIAFKTIARRIIFEKYFQIIGNEKVDGNVIAECNACKRVFHSKDHHFISCFTDHLKVFKSTV